MKSFLSCLFAITLFGNIYSNNTSYFARPNQDAVIGEFGARADAGVFGYKPLTLFGEVNNLVTNDGGVKSLVGIQYYAGAKLAVTPNIAVTAAHGSWHNIDRVGRTQQFNRAGVELRLK